MQFLGFDPGGEKRFGWAVLRESQSQLSFEAGGVCSDVVTAIEYASKFLTGAPAGVGIDAPLHWTWTGDRCADLAVRRLVRRAGRSPSTVNHVNSLRGACLAQGIMLAHRVQAEWPEAQITEAHPKALLQVHAGAVAFAESLRSLGMLDPTRDAALAAYAAEALISRRPDWHDLVPQEQSPFFPANVRAHYWFPTSSG
jgi:hypothetical protein